MSKVTYTDKRMGAEACVKAWCENRLSNKGLFDKFEESSLSKLITKKELTEFLVVFQDEDLIKITFPDGEYYNPDGINWAIKWIAK